MRTSIVRHAPSLGYRWLAVAAAAHALILLSLWAGVFYLDLSVIPGSAWFLLALAWLVWPIALILHPSHSLIRVLIPCILGFVVLLPCVPTLWAFAAWRIGGLAPWRSV